MVVGGGTEIAMVQVISKNSIDKLARPGHLLRKQTKVKIKLTVRVKRFSTILVREMEDD